VDSGKFWIAIVFTGIAAAPPMAWTVLSMRVRVAIEVASCCCRPATVSYRTRTWSSRGARGRMISSMAARRWARSWRVTVGSSPAPEPLSMTDVLLMAEARPWRTDTKLSPAGADAMGGGQPRERN
jgi:hypothetical protein